VQQEVVDLLETNKAQKKEIATLGRAQARSDKEMSELRVQFAREQANEVKEQEAMKGQIVALRK
jgi:hypothetical protein